MKLKFVSVTALAVVALAACTTSPQATETVTVPVHVTETTAAPAPTDTSAVDCPAWSDDPDAQAAQIDFNRFTGICVGMTFKEASAAAGIEIHGDAMCPWSATIMSDDTIGLQISAVSSVTDPSGPIEFFRLGWYDDPTAAWAYDVPSTDVGVRPGTPQADVAAWYPDSFGIEFNDQISGPRDQQVIPGPDGLAIVADIVDGYVGSMAWGKGLENGGPDGFICE